jgi:hypothetical protein
MRASSDEGGWGFERVVGMERVGAAIPPVVDRIFFGRQHLTFDKGGKGGGEGRGMDVVLRGLWGWRGWWV